jgi:hypothetical protein
MTTTTAWADLWFGYLTVVAVSFGVIELSSIAIRKVRYGTAITDWTLSDCVRRWAKAHHWLPAVLCGFCALLMVHFFWAPAP